MVTNHILFVSPFDPHVFSPILLGLPTCSSNTVRCLHPILDAKCNVDKSIIQSQMLLDTYIYMIMYIYIYFTYNYVGNRRYVCISDVNCAKLV